MLGVKANQKTTAIITELMALNFAEDKSEHADTNAYGVFAIGCQFVWNGVETIGGTWFVKEIWLCGDDDDDDDYTDHDFTITSSSNLHKFEKVSPLDVTFYAVAPLDNPNDDEFVDHEEIRDQTRLVIRSFDDISMLEGEPQGHHEPAGIEEREPSAKETSQRRMNPEATAWNPPSSSIEAAPPAAKNASQPPKPQEKKHADTNPFGVYAIGCQFVWNCDELESDEVFGDGTWFVKEIWICGFDDDNTDPFLDNDDDGEIITSSKNMHKFEHLKPSDVSFYNVAPLSCPSHDQQADHEEIRDQARLVIRSDQAPELSWVELAQDRLFWRRMIQGGQPRKSKKEEARIKREAEKSLVPDEALTELVSSGPVYRTKPGDRVHVSAVDTEPYCPYSSFVGLQYIQVVQADGSSVTLSDAGARHVDNVQGHRAKNALIDDGSKWETGDGLRRAMWSCAVEAGKDITTVFVKNYANCRLRVFVSSERFGWYPDQWSIPKGECVKTKKKDSHGREIYTIAEAEKARKHSKGGKQRESEAESGKPSKKQNLGYSDFSDIIARKSDFYHIMGEKGDFYQNMGQRLCSLVVASLSGRQADNALANKITGMLLEVGPEELFYLILGNPESNMYLDERIDDTLKVISDSSLPQAGEARLLLAALSKWHDKQSKKKSKKKKQQQRRPDLRLL